MGLEHTALPTSWGRIGPECLNLTVPSYIFNEHGVGYRMPDPDER